MNSSQRNNVTEIVPEEQFVSYSIDNHVVILIKHDYYSTDDSHGKELITSFIQSLITYNKEVSSIYLVSSGVKILQDYSLKASLGKLISDHNTSVFACSESVDEYSVDTSTLPFTLFELGAVEFFSEITLCDRLIVIE